DHIEAWIEQTTLFALAEDRAAPRLPALARGIDPAVAGKDARVVAVRERQALAVDSDPLHDLRVRCDVRALACTQAIVHAVAERRTLHDASGSDDASGDRAKLRSRAAVDKSRRTVAAAIAACSGDDRNGGQVEDQPVSPTVRP